MAPYFNQRGDKVEGHLLDGTRGATTSIIDSEIDGAIMRVKQGGSAKTEMAMLLQKHPILKTDKWQTGEHPLSPLVEYFVKETMGP